MPVRRRDDAPGPDAAAARAPGRWKRVALWVLQLLWAAAFALGAFGKLAAAPDAVTLFEAIGVGQWLRVVVGLVEGAGAVLLLAPGAAALGGALLALTMAGAVATHLFLIGGSPAVPAALLAGALAILWGRWDQAAPALDAVARHVRPRPATPAPRP